MPKLKTDDMSLKTFLKNSNIINKHPEIFNSGKSDDIKRLLDIFEDYTKKLNYMKSTKNNIDNVEQIVKLIKKKFDNINNEEIQKIESDKWNEHYIHYNNPDSENELYIFPRNNGGGKIMTDFKFLVNCFPVIHAIPNSIQLVNRNNHMIIAGEPDNPALETGIGLSFKILFLYNTKCKKWIVSPFKIVSETEGVDCSAFKISASNDDIGRQYNIWKKSLFKEDSTNVGILNIKFLDNKFKNFPNLFKLEQTHELIIKAKKLAMSNIIKEHPLKNGSAFKKKKKSKKKKSKKKKSKKKKSKKKG